MKLWGKDIPPNSREVSLLAIVETVAASALALWIAFGLGHLKWLALYVCLAPLLLLRTRYSIRLYSALCTALARQFPAGEPVLRYWLVFDMQLKMWHVAGLLGAVLTWWLYLKADQLRVKMQNGRLADQREQKQALRGLQALMVARAVCSAYTIFCGVVAFAKTQSWVTLDVVWVP